MEKLKFLVRCVFIIVSLLAQSALFAQFQFSGKIVNSENSLPIAQAEVTDTSTGQKTLTDANGIFGILTNGTLIIRAIGFIDKKVIVNPDAPKVIVLEVSKTVLDEVIVVGTNIPQKQSQSTQSISKISIAELGLQESHDLAAIINTVPGVFMQSATLNTNRITIRGIGARNLFGTANIRAYFGDIPLTDGNGESAIEDLELESIANITILKGPSSSTYGVGLGGTIILSPRFGDFDSTSVKASYEMGSFGFAKAVINSEIGLNDAALNFTISNTESDGYRENNNYDRKTFTLTSKINLSKKDEVIFLGSYIDLKGGIPSSLSKNDYENNPKRASFTWAAAKAYEDLNYGIFGISWNHDFNSNYAIRTSINSSLRDNYEPRPFNILKEQVNSIALRTRILGKENFSDFILDYTLGGEIFYDFYKNKTFENLYENFTDGRGSVQGEQLSGFKERRNYLNFFGEAIITFSEKFRVNAGINLNTTNFRVEDIFTDNSLENNGEFRFKSILSPKIGLTYKFDEKLNIFANASQGYSTPTTAETLLPQGEFNPNLKPETGWNLETGLRFKLFNYKLYGSVSIYNMSIKDLLVSRRTQQDDFFAINAGEANFNGLELELNYELYSGSKYQLIFSSGISFHDYTFDKFLDLGNDYSGNKIASVPSSVANFQLKLFSDYGFYGRIGYQSVGEMAVNDANSEFTDPYQLLNAILGYKLKLIKSFQIDLHVTGNNILDENYVSQVQVNAVGFGDNAPRFYYPGLPFNYYSGISLRYQF